MKTTDFAILFVAILLPIIIVVYVDISFVLKSEEEKLYYSNIINSAIDDATYAMKTVENEDYKLDYGYSGLAEKKISINPKIAVDTFFETLHNNFEIKGDKVSEDYIKQHVPAFAVIDYNGVYIYSIEPIYSIEEYNDKKQLKETPKYSEHVLKPKRYFTYTYGIKEMSDTEYNFITEEDLQKLSDTSGIELFTVIFSMDDYITKINEDGSMTSFYMEDETYTLINNVNVQNNSQLYSNSRINAHAIKYEIIDFLKKQRRKTISEIVSKEMSYAVNKHNTYSNIEYDFYFPSINLEEWNQMIDNVGIIAFVEGININNDKLDYTAHGVSGLKITDRYYLTEGSGEVLNYYHTTKECPNYKANVKSLQGYYMNQKDASSLGYYPCPICNP